MEKQSGIREDWSHHGTSHWIFYNQWSGDSLLFTETSHGKNSGKITKIKLNIEIFKSFADLYSTTYHFCVYFKAN